MLTKLTWALFLLMLVLAYCFTLQGFRWEWTGLLKIDGLTVIMWLAATFFSGIVHSFSRRYMAGNHHINQFFLACFAFTLSVMVMTVANHLFIFIAGWLLMGLFMARLIGHNREWGEAITAGRHALWFFLISTVLLTAGGGVLFVQTGEVTVSGMVREVGEIGPNLSLIAGLMIFGAAMMQSALFPFQSWLMSSMTAPTPASALMHAGFVNAGGILLARFAPLFSQTNLLGLIVIIGGIGALFGKFWKLVQPNIKRKLGCSTVSQMGFMILQCGLGFYTAAITHLILHGFYKAYLFLGSGNRVEHTIPSQKDRTIAKVAKLPIILLTGLAGGWLFAIFTGKGIHWDSGALLTFVVILTIIHGTQDIVKRTKIPIGIRLLAIPLLILPAVFIYALFFNMISGLMQGMPMVEQATPLTWHHGLITMIYLLAFLSIEFEWYKKSRWLYVTLMNVSQPHSETVLAYKSGK